MIEIRRWPASLRAIPSKPVNATKPNATLTKLRFNLMFYFLEELLEAPLSYGGIGSEPWVAEIIARLRQWNSGTNVEACDIRRWLLTDRALDEVNLKCYLLWPLNS